MISLALNTARAEVQQPQTQELGSGLPQVQHVATVAPDVLGITIQEGRVTLGRQTPYTAQPGDQLEERKDSNGFVTEIRLMRAGQFVGRVTGLKRDVLTLPDSYSGESLDQAGADLATSYTITSGDDPRYATALSPLAVYRKTKPNGLSRHQRKLAMLHVVYLKLPAPLQAGSAYRISLTSLKAGQQEITYIHEPEKLRSEAVHVNQNGFGPADPIKCAYLSVWLGTGGVQSYGLPLKFHLIDDASGGIAHSGDVTLAWPAATPESMATEANRNHTDVYRMDFDEFDRPGRYRVYVEGIGCSYPFDIRPGVWQEAFSTSVRGVFHHRSGIALGPPYTDYIRPRPHHLDDGFVVHHSTCTLVNSGNGLNALGTDTGNFGNLVKGRTDQVVPNAWGGMMDAGDWDRRVQHIEVPLAYLELLELAPQAVGQVGLNIPESGNDLPDVMDEALWIVDFYKRMQMPDGGVRGGIEAAEHPAPGDTSWTEILPLFAYAPDFWSSHSYAAVAARTARIMRLIGKPQRATEYEQTALKAMEWAEGDYARWLKDTSVKRRGSAGRSMRNLAALELYLLTGQRRWHDLFVQDTDLHDPERAMQSRDQRDAMFAYARLDDALADAKLKSVARRTILADADFCLGYSAANAYRLTSSHKHRVAAMGFYSGPIEAVALVRGHVLSGDAKYLRGVYAATQFCLGANPSNLSFTTGLGSDYPRQVLHEDAWKSGQEAPHGITVYGPLDTQGGLDRGSDWWFGAIKWFDLDRKMTPTFMNWPSPETYVDIWNWVSMDEYTPQQTFAPTAYVWGYLAALER
jgi:endoglucanase